MTITEERRQQRRDALKSCGKTLEQVARECGLKPATVRAYIHRPATHRRRALRIARAIGCDADLMRR